MFRYKNAISFFLIIMMSFNLSEKSDASEKSSITTIALPKPDISQGIPLNSALKLRRSHRRFSEKPISLANLSQLLWSAQGITHFLGFRTAPSAGAIYPLEIYVLVSNVDKLSPGIYHYKPKSNELELIIKGNYRKQLTSAANQRSIKKAAATLVISAVFKRTEKKYGPRAKRYVHIESGSAAQNVYLQATSLQLNTILMGSFNDKDVKQVMQLPEDNEPLSIMPIGHRP